MRLLGMCVIVALVCFSASAMAENKAAVKTGELKSAIFAGGSFWSLEKAFEDALAKQTAAAQEKKG